MEMVQPCSSCFCGSAMNSCTLFVHPGPGVWTPEVCQIGLGESSEVTFLPPKNCEKREVDPKCKKRIKTPPRNFKVPGTISRWAN